MNTEVGQQNSLSSLGRSEADNYTDRSCDQEILSSTSKCSTETGKSVGENVNDEWGSMVR